MTDITAKEVSELLIARIRQDIHTGNAVAQMKLALKAVADYWDGISTDNPDVPEYVAQVRWALQYAEEDLMP